MSSIVLSNCSTELAAQGKGESMKRQISSRALVAIVGMILGGCFMYSPPPQKMSGTLHSVRPAGGGPPTGWVLSMGPAGMGGASMDLDVSKVKAQAEALDGKEVQVTAEMKPNSQTLVVQSIGVISQ
jgi:hypothetical protein